MNRRKLLEKALSGSKNIRFDEFTVLLEGFGFVLKRINGSHHIYRHPKIARAFPVQNEHGKAKPYQVRQLLELIEQYDLRLQEEADEDKR